MLLVLATLQEYVRMVAVETVGQLTLEVPRPEGSSGEQLEDSVSTLTFLLVKIWVLCAVVPCVSWKRTNFCMCQTAQAQAKFGAFASRRSKSRGEFFQDGEAVFCFCWESCGVWTCLFVKKKHRYFLSRVMVSFPGKSGWKPRNANSVVFLQFLLIH